MRPGCHPPPRAGSEPRSASRLGQTLTPDPNPNPNPNASPNPSSNPNQVRSAEFRGAFALLAFAIVDPKATDAGNLATFRDVLRRELSA